MIVKLPDPQFMTERVFGPNGNGMLMTFPTDFETLNGIVRKGRTTLALL